MMRDLRPGRGRELAAFFAALALVAGCGRLEPAPGPLTAPPTVRAPLVEHGAPVEITARIDGRQARIELAFDAPARAVVIDCYGVGGLRLEHPLGAVALGEVEAGAVRYVEASLAPGSGDLAVEVEGEFGGFTLSRVVSFSVGSPARPRSGTTRFRPDGRRLRVLPARHGGPRER